MSKQDYYELLGVSRDVSESDLKKAYRKKAMALHPDRNKDNPDAETQFKKVNEAYDILKDPEKRAAYDRFGHQAFDGGMGAGGAGFGHGGGAQGADFASAFSDVFDDLFGDFMGGGQARGRGQRASRGSDLRYNLRVSLKDAFLGRSETISVPTSVACESCKGSGVEGGAEPDTCPTCAGHGKVRAQQGFFTIERSCPTCAGRGQIINNPCNSCRGRGTTNKTRTLNVNIPEGVETGTRIRLSGEGEAGSRGGPTGDLYIFIEVEEHPIFQRDGKHLFCHIPVPMVTAALGGEIEAPTIDGGRAKVKIPAGAQSGKQMRLRGKGMPALRGSGFGDLMIELSIETPVNLTSRQKELLQEFESEANNNNPSRESFLGKVKKFWDSVS